MEGVKKHLTNGDMPLFVAFGGVANQLSMPPFEFKNFLTKNFGEVNFIFIRDLATDWYFSGIKGLSDDLDGNVEGLRKLVDKTPHTKTIFLGNSMGAYASILYGTLLDVDHILAFAPQTFIDRPNRKKCNDKRWPHHMRRIHEKYNHKYFDLTSLEDVDYNSTIKLFCSKQSALDMVHANHIRGMKGVNIHDKSGGGHGVIKILKNNGTLKKIIENILNEEQKSN